MILSAESRTLASSVLLLMFVASGCSNTSSENVTTQGIHADIRVIAEGNGSTTVRAELEVGSGGIGRTQLDLSPGDSLTVTANGIQKTMVRDGSIFGDIEYVTSFPFDDANTVFVVALIRNAGTSAPNSTVTLPDGFNVLSPTSSTIYSTSQNIGIVWAPSGTSITPSITVTVECRRLSGITAFNLRFLSLSSDSGTTSIPVASVMPTGILDTARLCDGTVSFERVRTGNLDRNYGEGGQITAEQHQDGHFFIDPAQ